LNPSLHNFDAWLTANRAELQSQLNECASSDAISSLRQHFSVEIPTDFCDYLAWHDGQPYESDTLYGNKRLMPLRDMMEAAQIFRDCAEAGEFATDDWWVDSWLPFVADGGGNHIVLDLASGAVHEYWKSDADRPNVARSFSDWLDQLVNMFSSEYWILERGAFIRASDSTPADAYEKVSVVLLHPPNGGLHALKSIYDQLALSYGIGKLLSDSKRGPVTLLSGIYYMEACRLLGRLDDTTPFEIRSEEYAGNVYPASSD